jgi:membrane fusion protein, copper/silver efflux system
MKEMIMMKNFFQTGAAVLAAAFLASACAKPAAENPAEASAAKNENSSGTIQLTPAAVDTGGIATEAARSMPRVRRIAASGEMGFNARRLAHLSARATGRLERVLAFKGDHVTQGQLLAEMYSPEYLALQAEFLQAADRASRLRGDPDETAAASFLDAARRKLAPLGVSAADIDQLAATRTVRPFLAVRTPLTGTVIETNAVEGDRVELETEMFKLADLTSLWAELRIFEKDLSSTRLGMDVLLRTQAYPGEEFRGRLVLLGGVMDDKTRTVEGRAEIANSSGRLKPGMYVEAVLSAPESRLALVIPETALQEFQNKTIVFVQTGPDRFVLRPVATGARADGLVEIVKGLVEGERVVTTGSFLLKSEMLKNSLED